MVKRTNSWDDNETKMTQAYNMTEEETGMLLQTVKQISENIAEIKRDTKEQTQKMARIETVLFDEAVGVLHKFPKLEADIEEIKTFITEQKTKTMVIGGLAGGALVVIIKAIGYLIALIKHV